MKPTLTAVAALAKPAPMATNVTPEVIVRAEFAPVGSAEAASCPAGQMLCGAQCVNEADPSNCGSCGYVCPKINDIPACTAGACTIGSCLASFADCNSSPNDGCEVNTFSDPNNCGTCGHACLQGETCSSGSCTCGAGLTLCMKVWHASISPTTRITAAHAAMRRRPELYKLDLFLAEQRRWRAGTPSSPLLSRP